MGAYAKSKFSRKEVEDIVDSLTPLLKKCSKKFQIAGSYRREKFRIGDMDFILANGMLNKVKDSIDKYYPVIDIPRSGQKILSVVIRYNKRPVQIEFINVPIESFGAALLHSTGSGKFNIGLRSYAKRKNLLLNQYGLLNRSTRKPVISAPTEERILSALGLKYIPPRYRGDFWSIKDQFSY